MANLQPLLCNEVNENAVDLSQLDPGIVDIIDLIQQEFTGSIETLFSCEGHPTPGNCNLYPLNVQMRVTLEGFEYLLEVVNKLNEKALSDKLVPGASATSFTGFWELVCQNSCEFLNVFPKWGLFLRNACTYDAVEIGRKQLFEAFYEVSENKK
jgi:hypothetical protein